MTDNLYGFESTDEVELDKLGLPIGEHRVMIKGEEPDVKDGVTRGIIVEYEVVEGEAKGKTMKQWLLTMHPTSPEAANIAKQNIKRIAEATGRAVTPSDRLKGRTLSVVVGVQKNDETRTEIKKYRPLGGSEAAADLPF